MLDSFLDQTLEDLAAEGLRRRMVTVSGAQDRTVLIDGEEYLNFCSNNYLGLANDPRLKEAALAALQDEGCGAGASRLVCGNLESHRFLEKELAAFKKTESCLLFNSGYTANVGIISALFGPNDIIFSDRLNHASIVDGIFLSRAEWRRYPHNDMAALESLLGKAGDYQKRVIITDAVFSMDGDIAPLPQIVALAQRYDCAVMVDEAHAFGVLGENGAGASEHFQLAQKIDIQMGTLSKAAGSFGAYCCGRTSLIECLLNKSRSFIYTTALPPVVVASARRAVEIIRTEKIRRQELWAHTHYFIQAVKAMGFDTLKTETPIVPIMVGDARQALAFAQKLREERVLTVAIRPPTVPPKTSRLRMSLMATHTRADLDRVLEILRRAGKELCLI